MEKFLDIRIEDKFKISDNIKEKFKVEYPLIITGIIDAKYYGKLESGNFVELKIESETLIRKIVGVDYFTLPIHANIGEVKTRSVGLLIECESKEGLNKISGVKLIRQTAIIYIKTK
ncbi:hypothetical protein EZY14_017540 [Kordia sp. TARA_039_SRF]|nr:hypothetical protein EZY14_017540 [Kordia sp. TARA_039_SRF]